MSTFCGRIGFEAAFNIPPNLNLQWTLPGPRGPVELLLFSVFEDRGVGGPIPVHIAIDFTLDAPDLDTAGADALLVVGFVAPVLALAANAAYLDPQLVLAYHAGDELDEHELRANYIFHREDPVFTGSRELDPAAAQAIVQALIDRGETGIRLHRAMVHYNEALLQWRPESALKSVEWLFVAVENMAPIAFNDHRTSIGKGHQELAADWSAHISPRRCPECGHSWVPNGSVEAAARVAVVLDGNEELFKKAKNVSEGLEHGFSDMPGLHQRAADCRDPLAEAVRAAILHLLKVDGDVVRRLEADPYATPQRRDPVRRGVKMLLRGSASSLAPEGERHPILDITVQIDQAVLHATGKADLTVTDNLKFRSGGATGKVVATFASDRATNLERKRTVVRSADGTIKFDEIVDDDRDSAG